MTSKSSLSSEVMEKSEKHQGKNIHINIQNGVYNHGFMEVGINFSFCHLQYSLKEQETDRRTVHERADSVPNTKFIKVSWLKRSHQSYVKWSNKLYKIWRLAMYFITCKSGLRNSEQQKINKKIKSILIFPDRKRFREKKDCIKVWRLQHKTVSGQ